MCGHRFIYIKMICDLRQPPDYLKLTRVIYKRIIVSPPTYIDALPNTYGMVSIKSTICQNLHVHSVVSIPLLLPTHS